MTESEDLVSYNGSFNKKRSDLSSKDKKDKPTMPINLVHANIKVRKIVLLNFLSFEHDETILDDKFTIITGPNGAGKSSIYQALKFALGSNDYDGRYNKWESFIRSGYPYAKVKVFIEVDKKEYIIQRTVYRKKSPKYSFKKPEDKKIHRVSSTTIKKFTQKIQIEPDNVFSFLSQGDIDSIKDFKEETLCIFIEKGIGLDILHNQILEQKDKMLELQKEFDSLLSRKENLNFQLLELVPKLKRLKKKKELLIKYDKLHDELLWAKRKEIQNQIKIYQQDIKKIRLNIKDLTKKISDIEENINKFENELKQKSNEIQKITNNLNMKEIRVQTISKELNKWTTKKNEIADKIEIIKKEINDLEIKTKNYSVQLTTMGNKSTQLEERISNEKSKLNQFHKEERKLNKIIQQKRELIRKFDSKKHELASINEKLENFKEKHQNIELKIDKKLKNIRLIQNDLKKYSWFMKNPRKDLQLKMKKLANQYRNTIKSYKNELNQLQIEYGRIQQKMKAIGQSVYDKSMPKPFSIRNVIREIKDRRLSCIGPLIDFITFDDLYQLAVKSIFGYRVLYSFIAKDRETFYILKNIVQRFGARCNLYMERNNKVQKLPKLPETGKNGIFGYLVNKIKPIIDDSAVKKVISTVANRTIIVKDQIIGTNYIRNYNYSSWIVTLDGEQIRPKKLVIESRPYIKNKKSYKISSVAQAKKQLKILKNKSEENRSHFNTNKSKINEMERKVDILDKKLGEIDTLLAKYKQMEIGMITKNNLISLRKKVYNDIHLINEKKNLINKELNEIKKNIPEKMIDNKNRLEELPTQIESLQKDLFEYQKSSKNYLDQINDIKIGLSSVNTEKNLKKTRFEELNQKLKTRDIEFFNLFQENMKLKNEIKNLKNEHKTNLNEKIICENKLHLEREDRNTLNIRIIKEHSIIDNYKKYIEEKQKKLFRIKEKIKKNFVNVNKERSISSIEKNILLIEKQLLNYRDVDDGLLIKEKEFKNTIIRIEKRKEILKNEVTAAKEAENKLEEKYFQKFENSIEILERSINNKFKSASLDFIVKLKLKGNIKNLGIQIITYFTTKTKTHSYPLHALSGGQRSMVGICLMLSLNNLKPSPINIYDECDMFLDEKNSQTVAKLIFELAKNGIQFVVLMPSKNKTLLHLASKVVGVTRNGKNGPSTVIYSKSKRKLCE